MLEGKECFVVELQPSTDLSAEALAMCIEHEVCKDLTPSHWQFIALDDKDIAELVAAEVPTFVQPGFFFPGATEAPEYDTNKYSHFKGDSGLVVFQSQFLSCGW